MKQYRNNKSLYSVVFELSFVICFGFLFELCWVLVFQAVFEFVLSLPPDISTLVFCPECPSPWKPLEPITAAFPPKHCHSLRQHRLSNSPGRSAVSINTQQQKAALLTSLKILKTCLLPSSFLSFSFLPFLSLLPPSFLPLNKERTLGRVSYCLGRPHTCPKEETGSLYLYLPMPVWASILP